MKEQIMKDASLSEAGKALVYVINGLEDNTMTVAKAREITNVAGKIIKIEVAKLAAYAMRKQAPPESFLSGSLLTLEK